GSALGDASLENVEGFVDQRQQAALDDLLVAVVAALRYTELPCPLAEDGDRLGIVVAGAVAGLVAIVAGAGLLAQAAGLGQGEVGLVVGRVRRIAVGGRLVDVDADIDAGEVADAEDG